MARFRGTSRGNRESVSRLGSKNSGILTTANGWNIGIKVYGGVNDKGQDEFSVYQTGGSNDATESRLLLTVVDEVQK